MPRPKKSRRVCLEPASSAFVPAEREAAGTVRLTVDEYEVLRLLDLEGLTQEQCAAQMQVARTTVTGIYDAARRKLADMLVNGRRLEIGGGDVTVCSNHGQCCGKCGVGQCHCSNPNCRCRPAE